MKGTFSIQTRLTMQRIALIILAVFLIAACGGGSDTSSSSKAVPQASFSITKKEKSSTNYGSPSILLTIKNTSSVTGYNVSCEGHAKNAVGTIIDTAKFFFAGLGNIKPGENAVDEGIFFDLESHSEYASINYDCSWLTRK